MTTSDAAFHIDPATEDDLPIILHMVRALAEYEKLSREVTATEEALGETLFGSQRFAEVVIARVGSEAVGFAVFFYTYSTFKAAASVYLEDLFVEPDCRGRGFGRKLLAHVAAIAVTRGCPRLDWSALDWNEPAIGFYRALGAHTVDEWTTFRLTGDALVRLAATAGSC